MYVLRHFSIELPAFPGQKIALIGPLAADQENLQADLGGDVGLLEVDVAPVDYSHFR